MIARRLRLVGRRCHTAKPVIPACRITPPNVATMRSEANGTTYMVGALTGTDYADMVRYWIDFSDTDIDVMLTVWSRDPAFRAMMLAALSKHGHDAPQLPPVLAGAPAEPWAEGAEALAQALREHGDVLLLFFLAKAPLAEIERLGGPAFANATPNTKHAILAALLHQLGKPIPPEKG